MSTIFFMINPSKLKRFVADVGNIWGLWVFASTKSFICLNSPHSFVSVVPYLEREFTLAAKHSDPSCSELNSWTAIHTYHHLFEILISFRRLNLHLLVSYDHGSERSDWSDLMFWTEKKRTSPSHPSVDVYLRLPTGVWQFVEEQAKGVFVKTLRNMQVQCCRKKLRFLFFFCEKLCSHNLKAIITWKPKNCRGARVWRNVYTCRWPERVLKGATVICFILRWRFRALLSFSSSASRFSLCLFPFVSFVPSRFVPVRVVVCCF